MADGTKQRMIEAAAGLFRTRGLTATSFTDVLDASGAARGAIYHHFPGGKAQLARDAVVWTGTSVLGRLAMITANSPEAVVTQFLASVRPAVEQSAGGASCAVAAVTVEAAQGDPELTAVVNEALQSWVAEMHRQLLAAGAEPQAAAAMSFLMVTFLEGAHVLCRAAGNLGPFDQGSSAVTAAAHALFSDESLTRTPVLDSVGPAH